MRIRQASALDATSADAQFGVASTLLARGRYDGGLRGFRGIPLRLSSRRRRSCESVAHVVRRSARGNAHPARRTGTGRLRAIRALRAAAARRASSASSCGWTTIGSLWHRCSRRSRASTGSSPTRTACNARIRWPGVRCSRFAYLARGRARRQRGTGSISQRPPIAALAGDSRVDATASVRVGLAWSVLRARRPRLRHAAQVDCAGGARAPARCTGRRVPLAAARYGR